MLCLYHGSKYKQNELMPGFKHTGQRVEWDKTESNEWLYATTDKKEAICQAFFSAFSQEWAVKQIHSHLKQITIALYSETKATDEVILEWMNRLEVYLYTIEQHPEDRWVKNNNEHNGLDSEWKTKSTIEHAAIRQIETINISQWLKENQFEVSIVRPHAEKVPAFLRW